MKKQIKISLICPLLHIDALHNCYSIWANTNLSFEIIFLGPETLNIPIPENCVYIQTNVKPVQAWAYGMFISNGELIMLISDDLLVPQNIDSLNVIYNEWEKEKNYKSILSLSCSYIWYEHHISGKYMNREEAIKCFLYDENDIDKNRHATEMIHRYDPSSEGNLIPMCGLMSKKFFLEIGGPDNRFTGPQADVEMFYRAIINHGGSILFSNIPWYEYKKNDWMTTNYSKYHQQSINLRHSISENEKNLSPMLFEINDTILTKNQGIFYF